MRASLIQLSVDSSESADERRHRAASLVRGRAGDDLVVLPELWAAGAWSYDSWGRDAEGVDGPTAEVMSVAARAAGAWLHAGSVVERAVAGRTQRGRRPLGNRPGRGRTTEETVTVDLDMAEVARIRSELPVPRDRVLTSR